MKPNVMIVDDDPNIRGMVALVLMHAGYRVTQAADGEACLEHLRAGFQGILLMDVIMPGLDGWETIQRMVDEGLMGSNLICMMTVVREPGSEADGLEAWVLDYLPKPFDARQLLGLVEGAAQCLPA
jgi:DNA-binding response OmpR family regulator